MRAVSWRKMAGFTALFAAAATSGVFAAPIQVLVNGNYVQFEGQQPIVQDGHTLVPLRGVLETLGAQIRWDPTTRSVTARRGSTSVQLSVGSMDASVNGQPVTLEVPAQLIGGSTMVPLRFISEALGAEVGWRAATQTVVIRAPVGNGPIGQNVGGNGQPGNAQPGNVQPGAIQEAGAPQGRGVPLPVTRDLAVTNFNVNGQGPFHPGDAIEVTMQGTPGGKAYFSVGNLGAAMAMTETTPGTYTGTFRVPNGAHGQDVAVVGRLELNGRSSPLVQANNAVTIAALPPRVSQLQPALNAETSNVRPTIYALFTPGSSAVDPAQVHLWINDQDVTAQSTVTPNFVTYTPPTPFPAGAVAVRVQVGDQGGLTSTQNWAFVVRPRQGIKSLVDSATGPLAAGDVLTLTLAGEPGGTAWATIPGVAERVALTETAPGQYTGSYTVRRGDEALAQQIVGHLQINGAQLTQKIEAPITIWTKDPMKPVITGPVNGSKVNGEIQVTGTADPGAKVEIAVTYEQTLLGFLGTNGTVTVENVTADRNGHFQTNRIPLSGVFGTSGVRYTIRATETNAAGQKSEATVAQVSS